MSNCQCTSCLSEIDGISIFGRQVPCSSQHVFCNDCFDNSIRESRGNSSNCKFGPNCNKHLKHLICPECQRRKEKASFHVPQNEPSLTPKLPRREPPKCPICSRDFNGTTNIPKLFPCSQYHVFCLQCMLNPPNNAFNQFNSSAGCESTSQYWTCFICAEIVQLLFEDVRLLQTVTSNTVSSTGTALCCSCNKQFDQFQRPMILFPCTQWHSFCKMCISKLSEVSEDRVKACAIYGEYCDSTLKHFICPECRDVTHLLRKGNDDDDPGIDFLVLIPVPKYYLERLRQRINTIREDLNSKCKELDDLMEPAVQNLSSRKKRCHVAQITGSSISIAGSIVGIVGLCLIPLTMATSSILSIVGGSVAAAGSLAGAGSSAWKLVFDSKTKKDIEDKVKKINNLKVDIFDCVRLHTKANQIILQIAIVQQANMEIQTHHKVNIGLNVLRTAVVGAKVGRAGALLAEITADTTRIVTVTARNLAIGLGSVAAAFIVVDAFFIYKNAKAIQSNDLPEVAEHLKRVVISVRTKTNRFLSDVDEELERFQGKSME